MLYLRNDIERVVLLFSNKKIISEIRVYIIYFEMKDHKFKKIILAAD